MKKICLIGIFILLFLQMGFGQDKFTLSGYIEDAETGEKLIGANIYDPEESKGTTTNVYGFYSLTLPADSIYLAVSYIGYETQYFKLDLKEDLTMNIKLGSGEELKEVVVTAEKYDRIEEKTQMSTVSVPIQQIQKLPALLGEVDVLKALQLLPGVQSGGEGTSGLYVRGGSPDQNLILLDGTPVYNVSHLFGFFSVFNADAIKNVKLTKGGYPARFGGRLSSILEINMKEGNMNEFHGAGTIGLLASKMTFEGPIVKDKTSFIISGRRTYADLLAKPFIKAQSNKFDDSDFSGGYHFYDINAKINHKFSHKDRIFLSVYAGDDHFKTKIGENYTYQNRDGLLVDGKSEYEFGLDWGNITSALRWNHLWSNKLFSNVTATYSRYQFDTSINTKETQTIENQTNALEYVAKYLSGIEDYTGKIDFDFVPNPSHYIRFGGGATFHTFKPGALQYQVTETTSPASDTTIGSSNVRSGDFNLYIEDDFSIGKSFKANIGVHGSAFTVENKFYASVQPRIGMRLMLPGSVALKGSFATMTQYLHLLTNEGIGLPTDLWLPSTARVKPEHSWQAALGVAKTFKDQFEFSVEAYYKKMRNLIAYKQGANFFGFTDWQDKIETGNGDSYGLEFFVQKKKGKFTGWAGYTLAYSNRQFENLNSGKKYPFKYDRRHDISIVAMYEFSEKIQLSAAWVYGSGNAVTLPISRSLTSYPSDFSDFDFDYFEVDNAEEKNSFRMNAYHRLDVSLDFIKKKKRYERKFTIGAYNVYNRKNPFFLYRGSNTEGNPVIRQVSLFPILPSFNWSFKF